MRIDGMARYPTLPPLPRTVAPPRARRPQWGAVPSRDFDDGNEDRDYSLMSLVGARESDGRFDDVESCGPSGQQRQWDQPYDDHDDHDDHGDHDDHDDHDDRGDLEPCDTDSGGSFCSAEEYPSADRSRLRRQRLPNRNRGGVESASKTPLPARHRPRQQHSTHPQPQPTPARPSPPTHARPPPPTHVRHPSAPQTSMHARYPVQQQPKQQHWMHNPPTQVRHPAPPSSQLQRPLRVAPETSAPARKNPLPPKRRQPPLSPQASRQWESEREDNFRYGPTARGPEYARSQPSVPREPEYASRRNPVLREPEYPRSLSAGNREYDYTSREMERPRPQPVRWESEHVSREQEPPRSQPVKREPENTPWEPELPRPQPVVKLESEYAPHKMEQPRPQPAKREHDYALREVEQPRPQPVKREHGGTPWELESPRSQPVAKRESEYAPLELEPPRPQPAKREPEHTPRRTPAPQKQPFATREPEHAPRRTPIPQEWEPEPIRSPPTPARASGHALHRTPELAEPEPVCSPPTPARASGHALYRTPAPAEPEPVRSPPTAARASGHAPRRTQVAAEPEVVSRNAAAPRRALVEPPMRSSGWEQPKPQPNKKRIPESSPNTPLTSGTSRETAFNRLLRFEAPVVPPAPAEASDWGPSPSKPLGDDDWPQYPIAVDVDTTSWKDIAPKSLKDQGLSGVAIEDFDGALAPDYAETPTRADEGSLKGPGKRRADQKGKGRADTKWKGWADPPSEVAFEEIDEELAPDYTETPARSGGSSSKGPGKGRSDLKGKGGRVVPHSGTAFEDMNDGLALDYTETPTYGGGSPKGPGKGRSDPKGKGRAEPEGEERAEPKEEWRVAPKGKGKGREWEWETSPMDTVQETVLAEPFEPAQRRTDSRPTKAVASRSGYRKPADRASEAELEDYPAHPSDRDALFGSQRKFTEPLSDDEEAFRETHRDDAGSGKPVLGEMYQDDDGWEEPVRQTQQQDDDGWRKPARETQQYDGWGNPVFRGAHHDDDDGWGKPVAEEQSAWGVEPANIQEDEVESQRPRGAEPAADEFQSWKNEETDSRKRTHAPPVAPKKEDDSRSDYSIAESLEDVMAGLSLETDDLTAGIASLSIEAGAEFPSAIGRSQPPRPFDTFRFELQYEVTRIALALGVPMGDLESVIPALAEPFAYDLHSARNRIEQWKVLRAFARKITKDPRMPEALASNIWQKLKETKGWPDDIELTGVVWFGKGQDADFGLKLNPLAVRRKCGRFAARFGSDRFLMLRLPVVREADGREKRGSLLNWLDKELKVLNRSWRCFYVRDGTKTSKVAGTMTKETFILGYFFAEKGAGLGKESYRVRELQGFIGNEKLCREEKSRDALIEWHMPLEKHLDTAFSKVWSRVSLGLSASMPTVTFQPGQVKIVPDMKSPDGKVMNDGCSVCSPRVMTEVRVKLNLPETPTAVQGRLGGAKGVWFVDPDADDYSEELYIMINASQLKYDFHDEDEDEDIYDWARMTLFVLNYSKEPSPATLNIQLVPILSRQGVPFEAFQSLLEMHLDEDLEQLLSAASERTSLRHWLCSHGLEDRYRDWEIQMLDSGTPLSNEEQVAMLLDAGFDPVGCGFLMEKMKNTVTQQCDKLLEKLHIRVPCSATLYCIADPTGTLEEGEVSLQFSKGFLDPVTLTRRECIIGDLLVARNPAHLPTDIQKVKAVLARHPGLRRLKDIIIFSTKGKIPLADMLSGGDYDGDKPWICWDRSIVDNFKNNRSFQAFQAVNADMYIEPADPEKRFLRDLHPDFRSQQFYKQFFRRGFASAIQEDLLGLCTNALSCYTYFEGSKMIDKQQILLARLCGILVDLPKQGNRPTRAAADMIYSLMRKYPGKPGYKDLANVDGNHPTGNPESWYILDRLILDVGKRKVAEKKQEFMNHLEVKARWTDPHLTELWRGINDGCTSTKNKPLRWLLQRLDSDMEGVHHAWESAMHGTLRADNFKAAVEPILALYQSIRPAEEVAEQLRPDSRIREWYDNPDQLFSEWRLLKASKLFARCSTTKLAWWMAMPELCYMKAMHTSSERGPLPPRIVCNDMYILLKAVAPAPRGDDD